MKRFFVTLWLLLHPKWWIQIGRYSSEWDAILGKALDNPECHVTSKGKYIVIFDGYPVWIENYPYGYGGYYKNTSPTDIRPSRYNVYRLGKIVGKPEITFDRE